MQFDEYIMSNINQFDLEIINLLIQGYTNKEIAKKIHVSPYSVKYHLKLMFRKFNAIDRNNFAYILGNHVKSETCV